MSNSPLVLVTCATGKTGNIGGHVANALHRRTGFRIRIGARDVDKAISLINQSIPDATYVRLDLTDPNTFAAALEGVDSVFLGHPEHGFDDKELQQAFMDAVSAVDPRPHVVKFTAAFSAEYMRPFEEHAPLAQLTYGLKNIREVVADFKAKHGDKSVTVVEGPSWFHQSYTARYKEMLSQGCLTTASADAPLPRIDSRDIAAAITAVLARTDEHGGRVLSLTGGEALTETQLLQELAAIAGRHVTYSPDPSPLRASLQAVPIAAGVSLWDEMQALWAVEKHWAEDPAAANLKPKVFEELTGERYRTWAAFVRENTRAWDPAPALQPELEPQAEPGSESASGSGSGRGGSAR